MTHQQFAPPSIEIARQHITALLNGFRDATGLPATFVARLAINGDAKFAKTYPTANFSFGTYDAINSRLSAVWPTGHEWPAGVPRQAPAQIEPEVLADFTTRLSRAAAKVASPGAKEETIHG